MLFDLSSKVALVAGGAGYLGQDICKTLAGLGAAVVVADLAADRARSLAEEIRASGAKAIALELDVADEASSRNAVERTVAEFGRLDILVNATFFSVGCRVDELQAADFDRANHINLTGTFILAREAATAMKDGGSIVLFSSMYGLVSPDPRMYHEPMNPNPLEYGAGKAGIVQMARYLAVAWGRKAIRVNAIAPGPFPSPTVQERNPEFLLRLADRVPLGRFGRSPEIAGVAAFLASDASSYVTGTTIPVDGGWTVW